MASLPCTDPAAIRLDLNRRFTPSEPRDGDELYPNGIFEFNITRLLVHIGAAGRFPVEFVRLDDIPHAGKSEELNELAVIAANLSRPVILAEIAPGRYNLIDGHHRVAKARREGVTCIPAYRIHCPEHVAFLTTKRAYEAYVKYWNSKVDDLSADNSFHQRTRGTRAARVVRSSPKRSVRRDCGR
jgi:hypothetical protein